MKAITIILLCLAVALAIAGCEETGLESDDVPGIEPDDVIMSFNYRKVRTLREFLTELSGSEVGDRIRICLMRGEIRKTVYPVLEGKPQTSPETFVSAAARNIV